MSTGCLRWALRHAARSLYGGGGTLSSWRPASRLLLYSGRCSTTPTALSWGWSPFSTTADDTGEGLVPKNKKKQDPRARATIGSVGRKIHQRHLQVINETGEDLGTMHRADVLRLMDVHGLKLVPVNEHKDPPVYRLMSGKQIHEEQLKLREKQKAMAGPVQVKELTLSSDIATHDLVTKLKQVQSWLEKKHHVKMTLRAGRVKDTQPLDTTLEKMVEQIEVMVGFVSKPKVIREGRSAMCVLRPPSAKELAKRGQSQGDAAQSTDSSSQPTKSDTLSPGQTTDLTKDS